MLNVQKLWFLSCFTFLVIIVLYFHLEIARLEEQQRQLEYKLLLKSTSEITRIRSETYQNVEDLVVIYNRVPKTGSTSFVGLAYDLCKRNAFKVLHINITANMHVMTLSNQFRFVQNVTNWNEIKPAFYHGHMAYLHFELLGSNFRPLYINIIRKPLDRLVSYYYFLRNGDNFRPHLVRKKHGDKISFDECVEKSLPDCDPNNIWMQIPFFCGHSAECWKPGNPWALEQAKINLVNHYFLVGVTEELDDFVNILEAALPRLFKGASEHFKHSNKSHLRQTSMKTHPSPTTETRIKASIIWRMENEFYEFALNQFHFIKTKIDEGKDGIPQIFFYEKIRPK